MVDSFYFINGMGKGASEKDCLQRETECHDNDLKRSLKTCKRFTLYKYLVKLKNKPTMFFILKIEFLYSLLYNQSINFRLLHISIYFM